MTINKIKNCTVIKCETTRLDASYAPEFRNFLLEKIENTLDLGNAIILDLSNVGFMDSSGLGAIVSIFKKLGSGTKLLLCGLNEQCTQLMKVTRLDSIFKLYQDVPSAVMHDAV